MISFIFGHCLTLWQAQLLDAAFVGCLCAVSGFVYLCSRNVIALHVLVLTLGLWSATTRFQWHNDALLPVAWERKDLVVEATVVGLPKHFDQHVSFTTQVMDLGHKADAGLNRLLGQRLLLNCYRCPFDIKPNQTWRLTVRLKRPRGYASAGAFDYEKYLFRQQIAAKGYVRSKSLNVLLVNGDEGVDHWRLSIKRKVLSALANQHDQSSEPSSKNVSELNQVGAATILALSIGDKSLFTRDQRALLQTSGLSHLIAISGLHIGLIFSVMLLIAKAAWNRAPWLFNHCPRPYLCLPPALICAGVYAALAGFSVSTQRALIMLFVFACIRLSLRSASLFKVLLIAASMLLAFDPFSILDAGFWLSCTAVAVIALVASQDPSASIFKLQPALWLGMMPITVVFFGHVSLVSPVLNLIAVPIFCVGLIPLTLLAVLLNQLGAPILAGGALKLLETTYQWIFSILQWVVSHPLASTNVPELGLWQWGIFALLITAYLYHQRSLLWLAPLFLLTLNAQVFAKRVDSHVMKLTLLDVGQGLSLVVQTAKTVTVYDTGPRYGSGFSAAQAVLLPYLQNQGIKRIDRLIISHADNDHIGGYEEVMNNVEVGEVLTSRTDKLPSANECLAGQSWREGATMFHIISPQVDTPSGSNNRSCVLRIIHGDTTVLLTGDIEKQVERFLLQQQAELQADIVLVPHQGSKTSSTANFIDAVQPQLALVAAGYQNHYGHPHPKVVKRYRERDIQVLSTIESGSIELIVDLQGFSFSTYRSDNKRFWR